MKVNFNQMIPVELESPKKYFEEGKFFFNLCDPRSGRGGKLREVSKKIELIEERSAGRDLLRTELP